MRVWGRTQRAGQRLGLQAVGLSGQGPERLQWELERLQGRAELSLEEAGRKAWGPPLHDPPGALPRAQQSSIAGDGTSTHCLSWSGFFKPGCGGWPQWKP